MTGRPRSPAVDDAVLSAATNLLAEGGWSALTVEKVAAQAGVAKTSVYRRWPNKDELGHDAINRLKGPLPLLPGVSVRDDLLVALEDLRRQWLDPVHGRIMRRVLADSNEYPQTYRSIRDRLVRPRQELMRTVLRQGVEQGLIRAGLDLNVVVSTLTAPIVLVVLTHDQVLDQADVEFIVDTVLAGIAPTAVM